MLPWSFLLGGSVSKFSATLETVHDEVFGTVELPADDPAAALDCLAALVNVVGEQYGVAPDQVVRDLYAMVTGRVK